MKKIWNFISSMRLTAFLLTVFAVAIAVATFIESDFSTQTAQAEVYSARWFEVLLVMIAINLMTSMVRHSMLQQKKWNIVLFHGSFLVILLGAAITRYAGYEGSMHIRENETENRITTQESYIRALFEKEGKKLEFKKEIFFSELSTNRFDETVNVGEEKVSITLQEYIPNAVLEMVEDKENGKALLEFMITVEGAPQQITLTQGEFFEAADLILNFGADVKSEKAMINIRLEGEELYMSHSIAMTTLDMGTRESATLEASEKNALKTRTLYQTDGTNFVMRNFHPYVLEKLVSKKVKGSRSRIEDALRLSVGYKGKSKEVVLVGSSGNIGMEKTVNFDGMKVELSYGAAIKTLPFALKLVDFQLERYPGSMSPSSYASEVILIDKEKNINMPFRIYMNNILEHRNFRFFQSSFDQDEKGTILSVNNDPGTLPTYIGYTMLAIGMFSGFFTPGGRFRKLMKKGQGYASKRESLAAAFLGLLLLLNPGQAKAEDVNPLVQVINSFDKAHAENFGKLVTQDSAGRMKPLNTLNVEIVNKVRGEVIEGMSADQMVLGMMVRPEVWREINLIKTKNDEINKILGVDEKSKYAAFSQFLEVPQELQGYKLEQYVSEAIQKSPAERNKFDKEILKVDERFNIIYMVFTGSIFNLFPKPEDENNKWFATIEALQTFPPQEGMKVREAAVAYFMGIEEALQTGDWAKADEGLEKISAYQQAFGAAVYPNETKIKAEILYNKYNIFASLMPFYLVMGLVLLVLSFVKIIKPKFKLQIFSKSAMALLIVFFVLHTIGLLTRWYISGHAPWSNGYESMIFIAWATVLAGFIFSRNSPITLAATGVLSGLILFVAHLNWLDPQVTTLVPVLKSYWLSIHVSMITSSYGFLALGALLGFIVLILFTLRNKKNEARINLSILELNTINEMSLIVGLVLLTVGNFLGGVWANESWGRYWGWDPKETWALVSILLYAVVIHLRFIKAIYTPFIFATVSLLTFSSIVMTYFGVNYYLAGLHSYAKGDPVPVPDFVPWTYMIIFALILVAARNRKIEEA
ncbi:MAG: cytochrome c biogenesis protein CcsA [Campylobacterales bacterium]|nr:cytochrome c biogenesis protein CcsA [Campylobacterales bacterium]